MRIGKLALPMGIDLQGVYGNFKDIQSIRVPNGAGNTTPVFLPDSRLTYLITNITFGYTCDATVANRRPGFFIQPKNGLYSALFTRLTVADQLVASDVINWYALLTGGTIPYVKNIQGAANSFHVFSTLPFVFVTSESRIGFTSSGGVAGDSFSDIFLDVLKYEKDDIKKIINRKN